jgi:GntR family transcriptional regulator / MocR family aminotransferase
MRLAYHLHLDPSSGEPLYLQVSQWLREGIQQGFIQPGEELPGTRTLAERLGIGRNTVIAAFEELEAEGWLHSVTGQGTRVMDPLPSKAQDLQNKVVKDGVSYGFDLPTQNIPLKGKTGRVRLDLREILPDPRMLPRVELARALRRSLRLNLRPEDPDLESAGPLPLREALVTFLQEWRGINLHPDQILVARGEHHAVDLLARAFLRPGRDVVLESPGPPKLREQAMLLGAKVHPCPVDAQGIDVNKLAELTKQVRPRLLFVSPCAQIPTGVVLSEERRTALLELAVRERLALVELDTSLEGTDSGRSHLPLLAWDSGGVTVLVGGLQSLLGPALRLAWIAGPRSLVARLAGLQSTLGTSPEPALTGALRELLEEGTLSRTLRKIRVACAERGELLGAALHARGVCEEVPAPTPGGALWMPTGGFSGAAWSRQLAEVGTLVRPGQDFDFEGRDIPFLRVPFLSREPQELEALAEELAKARP